MDRAKVAAELLKIAKSLTASAYIEDNEYARSEFGKRDIAMLDLRDELRDKAELLLRYAKAALADAKRGEYIQWDDKFRAGRNNAKSKYGYAVKDTEKALDALYMLSVVP